jgi:DNA-binding MarR family transcriptional regulator
MSQPQQQQALRFWKLVHEACLQQDLDELSMRQMAILLKIYIDAPPHSVKTLSEQLNIPKAAVSRAIDSLSAKSLVKRERSKHDKRCVILHRTLSGMTCLGTLADAITKASGEVKQGASAVA